MFAPVLNEFYLKKVVFIESMQMRVVWVLSVVVRCLLIFVDS